MAGSVKRRGAVPEFVRMRVEAAEKRLVSFEEEAQRLLKDLIAKGKESRKDIRDLLRKAAEIDMGERAEEWRGRAEKTGTEVIKRLEGLQDRALGMMGVASTAQLDGLAHEIQKLARRVDKVTKTAANRVTRARAAKRTPPTAPGA
jgi:polyhydroxyalkanoate synthesis regulator phasin